MRRFRDLCLVVSVTVVFVLVAACSGDDPPASTGEPVVDTAAPATVPPATSVAPTTSRATATVTVPVTVPVTVTLPTSGDVAELIDESVAFSAGPIVRAWVDSAWSAPASDPFGYDYSLWVDELAAPSANVAGLRAGPLTVSLTELAELDLGDPFLEKMSADLRSMLWLEAALAGGDDWRVFETDPGFAVLAVSEATAEAALAVPLEGAHVVFDGLHDPVTVRTPAGDVSQVLWPVVVDVVIQRTDVQTGLVHSNFRFGTTLLLVPDPAVDGGFLIEATAVPGGFIEYSVVPVPAP